MENQSKTETAYPKLGRHTITIAEWVQPCFFWTDGNIEQPAQKVKREMKSYVMIGACCFGRLPVAPYYLI